VGTWCTWSRLVRRVAAWCHAAHWTAQRNGTNPDSAAARPVFPRATRHLTASLSHFADREFLDPPTATLPIAVRRAWQAG
jgi:hypothetical protein